MDEKMRSSPVYGPPTLSRLPVGWLLLVFFASSSSVQAELSARFDPFHPEGGSFEVVGLLSSDLETLRTESPASDVWNAFFTVHSLDEDGGVAPRAMLGRPHAGAQGLRFEPRFPPVPGLSYRIRIDVASLLDGRSNDSSLRVPPVADPTGAAHAALDVIVTVPQVDTPPVLLEQVYPTSSQVPANLLKFYLHFSGSMARGEVDRRVKLLDHSGVEVAHPFLEIDEELWDPAQRRLTLFFDPGRIKRGLRPHAEAGPPLADRGRYRLVVDAGWPDAYGRPLGAGFERRLEVTAADREPPRLANWQVRAPRAGSREPLVVTFGEPMDHALALRMIRVEDENIAVLEGTKDLGQQERRWRFKPAAPWRPGVHRLSVDGALEDLAGNSLRGAFDRDVTQGEKEMGVARFELPFVVEPY